jgi:hypothetical protein
VTIDNATVSDYERHHSAPSWVLADLDTSGLLARVHEACFYRATTLRGSGRVLARTSPSASAPGEPLALATTHGAGRVAVLGDSDLFGDDCLGDFGHRDLWLNPPTGPPAPPSPSNPRPRRRPRSRTRTGPS